MTGAAPSCESVTDFRPEALSLTVPTITSAVNLFQSLEPGTWPIVRRGPVVSTLSAAPAETLADVFPATSVACTVKACAPSVSPVFVNVKSPNPSTVVEPTTILLSRIVKLATPDPAMSVAFPVMVSLVDLVQPEH